MTKIRGKYLLTILAMCGLSAAAIGMHVNTAGVFFTPVADSLGVGRGNVSMTLTISNLFFATIGLLVPRVYNARRFRRNLTIFGLLYAVSTALHAAAPNLAALYLLSAVRGLSGGLAGNVVVTIVINNWFSSNVGLISSIALGCSGFSGAVFTPLLTRVISLAGWRAGYLAAAGIILILELPALLLPITYIPEASGLLPLGGRDAAAKTDAVAKTDAAAGKTDAAPKTDATAGKTDTAADRRGARDTGKAAGTVAGPRRKSPLRPSLLLPALAFAFITSYATSYPQHFPGIADSFGRSAAIGSTMVSVALLCNTLGKLLFGALADRFGAKITSILYIAVISAGFGLILLPGRADAAMLAGAAMIGFSYALPNVGIVMLTNDIFGVENYARVFPTLSLSATVANAIGSAAIGFAYDTGGSYTSSLLAGLALILSVVLITLYLYGRGRKR